MNIKITKDEFEFIKNNTTIFNEWVVGSKLYGTYSEDSDTDVLMVYESFFKSDLYYPNYHQLQYDDIENNTQYIISTMNQFYKNLFSGDSTINADVILYYFKHLSDDEKLNTLRTFNIIKSFIGFAKRDLKNIDKGKNKLFHIERSLYFAHELLMNRLPDKDVIKSFSTSSGSDIVRLRNAESELRKICNNMFDKGELTMYPKEPIISTSNSLESKIIEANNIKEFKYDKK